MGRTGRNNLPGIAITLYSPGEEDEIQTIENMGITFEEKAIKNHEIVDAPKRRTDRKKPNKKLEYDANIAEFWHINQRKTLNLVINVRSEQNEKRKTKIKDVKINVEKKRRS